MTPDDMKPFARVRFPGTLSHLVYELRYAHGPRRGWTVRLVDPAPLCPNDFYATRRALRRAELVTPAPAPAVAVICNPVIL
jgi:hypothetical protein